MSIERRFEGFPNKEVKQYYIDVLAWFIGERHKNQTDEKNKTMARNILKQEECHVGKVLDMLGVYIYSVESAEMLDSDKKEQLEDVLNASIDRYLLMR